MIGRVTQQTTARSTLANLQRNLSAMADLQNRLSGNTKITKPSDDPAGTATAMALRAGLRANKQASNNIDDGNGWLTTADDALQSSLDVLRQARDLTVQGSNTGSLTPQARDALASQIESLRQTMLGQANATYQGRTVFAGTTDAGSAITVTPADPLIPGSTATYASTIVVGQSVTRRIDANTSVRVDVDGSKAFGTQGSPTSSVFATLDRIAATLRSGGNPATELTALDGHRDAMLTELGSVGARQNEVLNAQDRAFATKTALTTQLSGIEDVDLAATVVELQTQEVAYKAALGATARVLQPSLLDFLR